MLRRLWLSIERYVVLLSIRLFRIREESERVARGFALGLVVNFFPTFGLGVLISGFVARLFGGNAAAGLVGGATLTFFWPALFYLNMRVGGLFFRPEIPVEDLEDVTQKTVNALVWGRSFMVGAVLNSLIAGTAVYLTLRAVYRQIRPGSLAYFRRHARDHQLRFRRPRPRSA
jgi:uncharacterized protein (DUF2062 family)